MITLIVNVAIKRLIFLILLACISGSFLSVQARERRGAASGDFDFFVLSLSWSPGFCEIEGRDKGRDQCFDSGKRGFVVHGLWPQSERDFPTYCGPDGRGASWGGLKNSRDVFPDEGLARYQWKKHGSCSGLAPSAYMDAVRTARDAVIIPQQFQVNNQNLQNLSGLELSPIEVEREFASANRGLRPDMMSVSCRRGVFQEIRICLSKDLRTFLSCPDVDRQGCRSGRLKVLAP